MNSVNYSPDLLQREFDSREPIRNALRSLRDTYRIERQDVAEFGSGLGYNLEIFSNANNVTGIEGLGAAATAATLRGVATIEANLASTVPLTSGSHDVVLCLDVLEHLLDPHLCLIEARRILRTAGLVVINVPNHFSLSGRINIARGSGIDSVNLFPDHADWETPHVRFFRHASIIAMIRRCGFDVDADWSRRFPSIPLLSRSPMLQSSRFARVLAGWAPDLFAGGFFLIARKNSDATRR